MQGQVFTSAIIAPDISSNYGFQGTAFTGVFDGNSHKITNFAINGNDYLGLFGQAYSGDIKNLGLENFSVSGNKLVGGLVGENGSSISNCYSTGAVSGTTYVGGLVGSNEYGSIASCCSAGNVSSTSSSVGGLVGLNANGDIGNSCSTAIVSGSSTIGGLVGYHFGGSITNCYSTGDVCNTFAYAGGLVGENDDGSITNSYSTGNVNVNSSTNSRYFGGLVGFNHLGSISNCYAAGAVSGTSTTYLYDLGGLIGTNNGGSITNCYSTGAVSGSAGIQVSYLGGLVGDNRASISNCYSTGSVNSNSSVVGGLVGLQYSGSISNCYSTGAVSGNSEVGGLMGRYYGGSISSCYFLVTIGPDNGYGEPLTDEQMKQQDSFIGWDFATPVWIIRENKDYPRLRWENSIPIAVAGPNQTVFAWINGFADVNLDGSASYDDDNDILDYYWSWTIDGNTYEANGVTPTIQMPVGTHTIELVVDDGIDLSEPNYCTITVISAVRGILTLSPSVLETKSNGKWLIATVVIPPALSGVEGPVPGQQVNTGEPLRLYPSGIEANHQHFSRSGFSRGELVEPARGASTIVTAFFDRQQVADALGAGQLDVNVVGKFLSGRFFFGSDTIKIVTPKPPPHH